jgi:hypothetical protein
LKNSLGMFALVLGLALLYAPRIHCADADDEETKEAREEIELESKLSEVEQIALVKSFAGKLQLLRSDENPQVIGQLMTTQGPIALKLEKPDILDELKPYNMKDVTLNGKLRNKGKYLVVTGLHPAPPPGAERKKRGGI